MTMTAMTKNKFWNVKTDGKKSNIDLFGYVGGSKDRADLWKPEGFNEKEFLDEIRSIPADNDLEISINSFGGSVYTALSIYTLLKAHKGGITFRIDGAAMSAATIITSVPNAKVIMPKGAMMMIHKVSTWASGNVDDLRKTADDMEALENNILDIYAEKTGKTVDEIKPLVDAETYFTAAEAVEFGLADEMDESKTVENRMVGDIVNVNGLEVSAEFFKHAPEGFINKADVPKAPASNHQANKEEKTMTLEQLKAEHPELVDAIRAEALNEGVTNERNRIKEIENIALPGYEEMVQSAKFEKPMTAAELGIAMIAAMKQKKEQLKDDYKNDAAEIANVVNTPGNEGVENEKPKTREEKIAEEKAAFEAAKNA